MNRNNNWLIAVLVVLGVVVLACCVLAVVAASVGWVADDAVYGPMMHEGWPEGTCPGCPGGAPGTRAWLWPVLLVVLGLLVLAVVAVVVIGAVVWAGRSNRQVEMARDISQVPEIDESSRGKD